MYAWAAAASASGKVRSTTTCRRPARDIVDMTLDHVVGTRVEDLGTEEHAGDRLIAHAERAHVERLLVAAGAPDGDAPPAIGQALHAALQHLAAHGIDDEVDALAAGELAHPVDPPRLRVVDAVVHAELVQRPQPLLARRGREHGRARALGELDRGDADAARAGLDQHGLARP